MPTTLITGTNRGLGLEFVRQYLADGWTVHACARRDSAGLSELLESHRDSAVFHSLDVTDHQAVDSLAQELAGTAIDLLLLSAGTMGHVDFANHGLDQGGFDDADFDDWEHVFRVNVLGPMKMAQAFVAHVEQSDQRKLIALSSMVASMELNTVGGLYAYRASKAGLNAVMHSMGIDLAGRGVIALPIHPGWARTEMGGSGAPVDPVDSVSGIRRVIADLKPSDAGRFLAYDGSELPW